MRYRLPSSFILYRCPSSLYCPFLHSTMKEFPMILAYIDPGSGSILIQVILASCLGGIVVFWSKIKSLFIRKKPDEPRAPDAPTKPD